MTNPPPHGFRLGLASTDKANAQPYAAIVQGGGWSVSFAEPVSKSRAKIGQLYELGLTYAAMSFHQNALETMQEVVSLAPDHVAAWRELAILLRLAARDAEAEQARRKAEAIAGSSSLWGELTGERSAMRLQRLGRKLDEQLEKMPEEERADHLRALLLADPLDVVAMRALAREEAAASDLITATRLLDRAISLSPSYLAARLDYVTLLKRQRNYRTVMEQTEILLGDDPRNFSYRLLRADAALHIEHFDEAVALLEALLEEEPKNRRALLFYGNGLKALGRHEDSMLAFRALLFAEPAGGSAYFGLSTLKADTLIDADIAAMRADLAHGIAEPTNRKYMAYALGQALERARDYRGSFEAYACGASASKEEIAGTDQAYNPRRFERRLARMRGTLTAETISGRIASFASGVAVTPIFIIGLPCSGSTLVEQILASHSLVEGTRELPVILNLTKKFAMSRLLVNPDVYPERVPALDRAELDAIGEECLRGIAEHRKTSRPYVIDKRPWNWIDAAFIHLILPQAKFIDIRRAPMAAGFAMFKQLLPSVAAFSYDLRHLGHYTRLYAGFMETMDAVMPGSILCVSYERLVEDTETETRRMLDHCGLPFEERCLRFWESDRAIMTPSAEQVRRPIFRDALQQWRNYEMWLGPLREALGDLAET